MKYLMTKLLSSIELADPLLWYKINSSITEAPEAFYW